MPNSGCTVKRLSFQYRFSVQRGRIRFENERTVIARLKAGLIADWRRERLDEGVTLVERPLLTEGLIQWSLHPQPGIRQALLTEFCVLRQYDGYGDVCWWIPAFLAVLERPGLPWDRCAFGPPPGSGSARVCGCQYDRDAYFYFKKKTNQSISKKSNLAHESP